MPDWGLMSHGLVKGKVAWPVLARASPCFRSEKHFGKWTRRECIAVTEALALIGIRKVAAGAGERGLTLSVRRKEAM